jgi:hypothetical protein
MDIRPASPAFHPTEPVDSFWEYEENHLFLRTSSSDTEAFVDDRLVA